MTLHYSRLIIIHTFTNNGTSLRVQAGSRREIYQKIKKKIRIMKIIIIFYNAHESGKKLDVNKPKIAALLLKEAGKNI